MGSRRITRAPAAAQQWPDASTTGPDAAGFTSRTSYSGPSTITTNGTLVEGKNVTTQLTIEGNDVTIRGCFIDSSDYYGILVKGTNCLIEDCRIVNLAGAVASIAHQEVGQSLIRRVDTSGGSDGVRLQSNCTLLDSYIHDLGVEEGSHNDAVTADGYTGWLVHHNNIRNSVNQTSCVWIGDPRYAPSEGVLSDNLLAGGGYTIYSGHSTGTSGLHVTGNHFSTAYYEDCGSLGWTAFWESPNNEWSGNVWHDGPLVGQTINPQ